MINYEKIVNQFNVYLKMFDVKNKEIMAKVKHSHRVVNIISELAKRMKLNEETIALLKTIGLFHDIGRFVQYKISGMYDDIGSNLNHADLGVDYLFIKGHIKDFEVPEKYYRIIRIAIANHNKLKIEKNLTDEELLCVKLIRDADKIDIFKVLGEDFKNTNLCLFEGEMSLKVKRDFFNHHSVDCNHIKTASDTVITHIAYVYDINFEESYKLLKELNNLEIYLESIHVINNFEMLEMVKAEVRRFLEEKASIKDKIVRNKMKLL